MVTKWLTEHRAQFCNIKGRVKNNMGGKKTEREYKKESKTKREKTW